MRELAKPQKQRFPYFGKWNFLALRLKNSHIFSKNKNYISGGNLQSPANKKNIIFWKM